MSNRQMFEGLGAPIRMERPDYDSIDPSLDMCCRREAEANRRKEVMQQTLRRLDVVAEKERRRRHLVAAPTFTGCRCCYDPNSDGGEYRALIELREELAQVAEDKVDLEQKDGFTDGEEEGNNDDDDDDEEEDEFDYLLDEEIPGQGDELKALEEVRRAELEMELFAREVAIQHGYGVLRQMHPNRVLKAAGIAPGTREPPTAVVLHLVDPDSIASATLDLCLEQLAEKQAGGTKFLRSGGRAALLMDAEIANQVLPRLKPDSDMPTLLAIRDGIVVNMCPGLKSLTDENDHVVPNAVRQWLEQSAVLLEHPPRLEEMCRIRPEEEALMDNIVSQKKVPLEERFDCGLVGCNKDFPHEHVGIQNEKQSGLVVSEKDVVDETE